MKPKTFRSLSFLVGQGQPKAGRALKTSSDLRSRRGETRLTSGRFPPKSSWNPHFEEKISRK
ncbi:hypothetical protein BOX30_05035 [Leptospirillum ferriphilum]|uniref:Uncharacterized protein n=2 Tax=Leptospirillum ferriphilum TaxID=178606 RepID=A0A059Y2D4_9BACT|nr:hypothetical protein Y981_06455 [Leptospirillum ferriphilum YSK]AKS23530.1 hypothetical protein ABH19_06840 [Leptospirillum sp. Group II 'CF-1']OOH71198.1 hypothetical protein BOX24_09135 [Leptospirillum ferriphilum]OOH80904.1 hypothetical protein BOX30_05035 [Leptospirillum ferriphilum]